MRVRFPGSLYSTGWIIALMLCATIAGHAAADSSSVEWNPTGLLFQPLRANVFEARVGTLYETAPNKLRLDIGNSVDLIGMKLNEKTEIRYGADFFTYTRLRSEGRLKFPVETADFYFGINSSAKYSMENAVVSGRLRIAHISSHLVDGYAGDRTSFVYSREFVDFAGAIQWDIVRIYAGANFLFSTKPKRFGIIAPQMGFDISYPLASHLTLIGGYDLRLPRIDQATYAVHAAQAGIKLGERYGKGISVNGYLFQGKSIHGMFFDLTDSYAAVGFQVEF